jgi:hypothetical protein
MKHGRQTKTGPVTGSPDRGQTEAETEAEGQEKKEVVPAAGMA